jgi:hypothetical protein
MENQGSGSPLVALAAGPSGPRMTSFADVAPLALMSSSIGLLRTWVIEILGSLAADDHNARLRKAEEALGRRATQP